MRAWQLYLDESGDFDHPNEAVLIAGVLFEGRATPQVSSALRRRLGEIFVGTAYPPHAAHHNVPTSLLSGVLAGHVPRGPANERFLRGIAPSRELALVDIPCAHAFRAEISRPEPRHRLAFEPLRAFDAWLQTTEPAARAALLQERDLQRADLSRYVSDELPGRLGHRPLMVAAWQAGAGSHPHADARYEQLYEVLLERALSFIARQDDGAHLDVHLAVRHRTVPQSHVEKLNQAEDRAGAFALLARTKHRPAVVRYNAEVYDGRVAPGIVLADFAANTLRNALFSGARWDRVAADVRGRVGLPASGACALLPLAAALPAVAADGPAREAIRRAAEASAQGRSEPSLASRPRWASEQADAWIAALQGEASR